MVYNDEDLDTSNVIYSENKIDDAFEFYSPLEFAYENRHYMFINHKEELFATAAQDKNETNINTSWILLDSQSTVDIFCNKLLLKNIRQVNDELIGRCNAGRIKTNVVGDLPGYGTVWFYAGGIANILSLYRVSSTLHVQYDGRIDNTFTVWKNDGTTRLFKPAPNGLYYCNAKQPEGTVLAVTELDPDQMGTVRINMTKYNQRQLKEAKSARYFQNTAGLSIRALLKCIDSGAMSALCRRHSKHSITIPCVKYITRTIWQSKQ